MRQLAQGARLPGVDLEMVRERGRRRRTRSNRIGSADGSSARRRRRGNGEVGQRVEGVDAVEELQVEGRRGLAVDLRLCAGHGDC
jgi:hypothetical protein